MSEPLHLPVPRGALPVCDGRRLPWAALPALLLAALPTLAATPYAKGDAKAGEALATRDCVSCHAAKFGGDADAIYTRKDRRVTTPAQLMAQVQRCNAELSKGYFPDEEESVAAFLDRAFYHFTR